MRLRFPSFLVVTFMLGSSLTSHAGSYVGVQYQDVAKDNFCESGPQLSCDDSKGFRASFGYKFNQISSIEFGYVDGGQAKKRYQAYEDTAELKIFDAVYVARYSLLEHLNLLGRAGLFYGQEKGRYTYVDCSPTLGCQPHISLESRSYEGATLGIGLEWHNFTVSYDVDIDLFNISNDYGVTSKTVARRLGVGYLIEF